MPVSTGLSKPARSPHDVSMSTMPTPEASCRPEPFGGYRHSLKVPLPQTFDFEAAVGPLDPNLATLVEFEPGRVNGWTLVVSVFVDGDWLTPGDTACLRGELAETWFRAVRTCQTPVGEIHEPPVLEQSDYRAHRRLMPNSISGCSQLPSRARMTP